MPSNDYDAGYADGRKDAQEKISKLEDEINHLEDNFTEWLKEYRAMTERVAALNAELACSIVSGNDAREQSLGYVYDLNSAAKRIAELEAELMAYKQGRFNRERAETELEDAGQSKDYVKGFLHGHQNGGWQRIALMRELAAFRAALEKK